MRELDNNQEENDNDFKEELRVFLLWFKDPELEKKYQTYSATERKGIGYLSITLLIFVLMLLLRNGLVILFIYLDCAQDYMKENVEITSFLVMLLAVMIEVVLYLSNKLAFLKGFAILIVILSLIHYTSRHYFPNNPGLVFT